VAATSRRSIIEEVVDAASGLIDETLLRYT
jgi:hypothetical protein